MSGQRKQRERLPVMVAITRRRGLCAAIAERVKSDVRVVWQWHRVPLKYAQSVADLTGLPVAVIRAEHKVPLSKWRIPLEEVSEPPQAPIMEAINKLKAVDIQTILQHEVANPPTQDMLRKSSAALVNMLDEVQPKKAIGYTASSK